MATILCVDDDPYLTDLLRYALEREGFEVCLAQTGRDALRLVRAERIDLILLDVNLPDINGFKVLSSLRTFSRVPVVLLTARTRDEDIIVGFGQGADDYVVKPFSVQVLVHRIKAVQRRVSPHAEKVPTGELTFRVQSALFDSELHEIVSDDTRVSLTPTESRILRLLCRHAGQPLSAELIMERVSGYAHVSDSNVIKTHIRHLREKISTLPGQPHPIQTMPGVGYVVPRADEPAAKRVTRGSSALQPVLLQP